MKIFHWIRLILLWYVLYCIQLTVEVNIFLLVSHITYNPNDGDSLDIPMGILCYEENRDTSTASPQLNPSRMGIILEGCLVLDPLTNVHQATCLLFGFTCALYLDLKCMKNTYLHSAGNEGQSELPPKVQKLKNAISACFVAQHN